MQYLSILDLILPPFYILLIYLFSKGKINKIKKSNPLYNYYFKGLFIKFAAAIAYCLIYALYYGGGDTTNYFKGAIALNNLFQKDFGHYSIIMFFSHADKYYRFFDYTTGFPEYYMWRDQYSFFVIKFISPIVWVSFKSYITSTIVLAWISYIGIWKLFILFNEKYQKLTKQLAIAILFFPSVVFWGSGIGKDTITFAFLCWFVYNIYMIFFKKEKILKNAIQSIIISYIILSIKPYIFITILPGSLMWIFYERIKRIKSNLLKVAVFPLIFIVGFYFLTFFFSNIQEKLGAYSSISSIVNKARITKEDLVRSDQYGENYFDIGEIDNSTWGLLKKAPKAIIAGLFRPFIWESNNIVMVMSGLENLFLVLFTIQLLIKIRIKRFFLIILTDPILLFAISFAIFFAFSVGLSTANFGALVRYKIPLLPFYLIALFIIHNTFKKKEGVKEKGKFVSVRELTSEQIEQ